MGRYAGKVADVDVSKADDANYRACTDAGKEVSYAADGATCARAVKAFVVLPDVAC